MLRHSCTNLLINKEYPLCHSPPFNKSCLLSSPDCLQRGTYSLGMNFLSNWTFYIFTTYQGTSRQQQGTAEVCQHNAHYTQRIIHSASDTHWLQLTNFKVQVVNSEDHSLVTEGCQPVKCKYSFKLSICTYISLQSMIQDTCIQHTQNTNTDLQCHTQV